MARCRGPNLAARPYRRPRRAPSPAGGAAHPLSARGCGSRARPGGVALPGHLARQSRAPRGFLTVDDHEVDAAFALQGGNERADRLTTGLTDDVADEEDLHRVRAMISNGVAVVRARSVVRGPD